MAANNADVLASERCRSPATLAIEMSEVFTHGSQASRETYMRLCKLLEAHLSFEDAQKMLSESIENQRVLALRLACLVEKLILMHRLSNTDAEVLRVISQDLTGYATPTLLHHAMFTKNLASIFTPEQVAAWGTPIDSFQWLGCYAQTELGHGSNLRSLETTATFLPDVDEFELHSPTLTSIKYWPGALASTANMAVVYARLLIHGTDHGVHSFLLQLRDFTTHKPLPGITVGHIGNKLAFNTVDNGYLKLDRVRIPRANMAMKFSTVARDGTYSRADGAKRELSYFTMLQMRFHMVHGSAKTLSKAATIAVRYSAIRLQGLSATAPHGEVRVLDYQSQQHRVLPRVAESFAIFATSHVYNAFCTQATAMVDTSPDSIDATSLAMAHAISCALKVAASELCTRGIEICRRACGGHGYLQSSGLPELGGFAAQFVTAEGENYVISQQTTRTLLKLVGAYRMGVALPPSLEIFHALDGPLPKLSATDYEALFRYRFLSLLHQFDATAAAYPSPDVAIQTNLIESHHLALCYGKRTWATSWRSFSCRRRHARPCTPA
ncbi:hypothetical protein, variant 1 [Aphanomyces invadans]|uniref:acyl-CoA oxidase n=1 Tax=Aphanomyces invadans TaxID=157072 RepID=A0A024UKP3_9STRA|nr:hypothetical protein, variant 1 [Aphanomyces invadans]ETW07011.1 hypothetical protein, variant 1 [Aphanomyces invadans]|eukprot:XP_008865086.1 hypothetical protein, variant 1 [Aphanomyces invadans]